MKSNSFMGGAALTTSRRLTQIFADKTQTLLGSPPPFLSVLVRAHPRQEFLDSQIAAHRFKTAFDHFHRSREGKADATLALRAEDDARNCCYLRIGEQNFSCLAAIRIDAGHVWKNVKRSSRRPASESEFVQSGDQHIASLAIFSARCIEKIRLGCEGGQCGPLRRGRDTV